MIAALLGLALAADGVLPADPLRPSVDAAWGVVTEDTALPVITDARAALTWGHHPLVAWSSDGTQVAVVEDGLGLWASAAGRLGPARVGLSLPFYAILASPGGPSAAVGDPGLDVKAAWRFGPGGLGARALVTAPLGSAKGWAGAAGPTWAFDALIDVDGPRGHVGANVGLRGGQAVDLALAGGDGPVQDTQLVVRGVIGRDFGPDWRATAELLAAANADDALRTDLASPMEVLVGGTRRGQDGGWLRVAAGVGLLPGVGAPQWRLVVGGGHAAGAAPRARPVEVVEVPVTAEPQAEAGDAVEPPLSTSDSE